jgi:hypothetical protein
MLCFGLMGANAAQAQVRVEKNGDAWQLLRNGQPYFVRGAGGDVGHWTALAANGGNSVRLWGDERLGEQLDAAQKDGLTVTAGIWLPQVRQGFDYTDAGARGELREQVRRTVLRYKDHPALLIWALGNEMEDSQGRNLAVWTCVNDLAALVKQIDPHHPTMTVVAEIGGEKVANFQRLCPSVDILGVNSYGGVQSLGERYRRLGGVKPYLLTEFGPPGIWEIGKDAIGAYPEPTSAEKAKIYRLAYKRAVLDQPDLCLGSYAFFWGRKQEVTPTWFSLFLGDGARLGAVDALAKLWTGQPPANRCPEIKLRFQGNNPLVEPGAVVSVELEASDPENDPLTVTWLLLRDPESYGTGGDAEPDPAVYPEAIIRGGPRRAKVRLPAAGGLYRLYAEARDERGGAAVANLPIRVNAPAAAKARRMNLPVSIYAENVAPMIYAPSGWMGDVKSIRLDPACADNPRSGNTCLRCEFAAATGWGGVAWQHPANDWGDLDGGCDLRGAKRLSFWARGARGGEIVDFKFGVIPRDKKYPDTAHGALEKVALTPEWRHYEIAVANMDLSRIKTGFLWSLASGGQPAVFYLDDIRWE